MDTFISTSKAFRERASIQVASTCLSFSERVRRSSERIKQYKYTLLGQLEAGAKKRKKRGKFSVCDAASQSVLHLTLRQLHLQQRHSI